MLWMPWQRKPSRNSLLLPTAEWEFCPLPAPSHRAAPGLQNLLKSAISEGNTDFRGKGEVDNGQGAGRRILCTQG